MKIQNTTAINNNTYTFSELSNGRTIGLYTATDVSNCKLSYIHGIGSLAIVSEQERKAIIDGLLNESKGCVILNTTNEVVANFIKIHIQYIIFIKYLLVMVDHITITYVLRIQSNLITHVEIQK